MSLIQNEEATHLFHMLDEAAERGDIVKVDSIADEIDSLIERGIIPPLKTETVKVIYQGISIIM